MKLSSEPPEGTMLEGVWPAEARLELSGDVMILWSNETASETVDYLRAGEW